MSSVPTVAPYGTWRSSLRAAMLWQSSMTLEEVWIDGQRIAWLEGRLNEYGRHALMEDDGEHAVCDRLPSIDIRSRVHEYGGGAFAYHDHALYFSSGEDQRIYRHRAGHDPEALTEAEGDVRYADLAVDPHHQRLVAVREEHDQGIVTNAIVAIDWDPDQPRSRVLASGHDFFMAPRVSPDGTQIAWLAWDLPAAPWNSSLLFVAPLASDGTVGNPRLVAGGAEESVIEPAWSPDNQLYFLSDRNGWWNLYVWRNEQVAPITALHAEFGDAPWYFGQSSYGFLANGDLVATYTVDGFAQFVRIDPHSREMRHIHCPFSCITHLKVWGEQAVMVATTDREPRSVVLYDFPSRQYLILARASQVTMQEEDIALPEVIDFPNLDGDRCQAFYYPPKNRDYIPPEREKPPIVVLAHGGPTDRAVPEFRLDIQYWTTRGFAVASVNYGGSTGYGRAYRQRLRGRWGIVDVDDLISAVTFLDRWGKADAHRAVLRGESAGGYSVLAALAFRRVFQAGTSYYGISDLAALAATLPKFESGYIEWLVGDRQQHLDRYHDRSPLFHADGFTVPVLFFHGLQDQVVAPDQSRALVETLADRGLPVSHSFFPGQGHGFSDPTILERCHEAELAFYARVLKIRLYERVRLAPTENWDD